MNIISSFKFNMTRLLSLIFVFWGILCSSTFSDDEVGFPWGQFQSPENVVFTIRDVSIGEWKRGDLSSNDGAVESMNMTAISYDVTNETENRKIDLTDSDLQFILSDEFGNIYHQREKPLNYSKPITVLNKNFPSLYPQETLSSTVFFEAPIKKSQVLNLIINAQTLGVAQPVSFHLPVIRALPKVDNTTTLDDDDLQVMIPPQLKVVKPGDNIPIEVRLAKVTPNHVYVIAPFYLFDDTQAVGHYDLRIPDNQQDGPLTVVVLTSWKDGENEQTLSKSFTIPVKRLKKHSPTKNHP
jgi:hypothetical protein